MAKIYTDTAGTSTANDGLTLDLWIVPLTARLAGATPATITSELQAAVREFYLQSNAWREQVGPYNVYAGADLVWLNPVDAYSSVLYIHNAWLDLPDDGGTIPLEAYTVRPTDGREDSRPLGYSTPDPYVLRLYPKPTENLGQCLWVDATLVPLPDATRLPNIAASHHYEPILEGALSRLLVMPNKPWTDPVMGMAYRQQFRRRCVQWRDIAGRGYNGADVPFSFPKFA
jgi:hypothetical protein